MAAAEDLWCQGWSEPDAGSDLAGIKSRAVRDEAAGGWRSPGRRPGPPAAPSAPTCSASSAPIPTPSATTGMTYLLVPLDAAGRHRARRRPARRRRGLRRGLLRGRVRPRRRRARRRRTRAGAWPWPRPAPSAASRCAARVASPPPPTGSSTCTARAAATRPTAATCARRRWPRPGWTPRPTGCYTLRDVTDLVDGRAPGAESSLNKVWWSELDVRLHETALELLGPRPSSRPTRRGRRRRRLDEGLPVLAVGPDLRRHQRDPAQRDRRARARPAAGSRRPCASPSPTTSSCSATPCATCWPRSARPSSVRCAWVDADGPRCAERVGRARRDGRARRARCPRRTAASGSTELDLVLLLEETGRVAVPRPDRRDRGGGRAAPGRVGRPRSGRLARRSAGVAVGAGCRSPAARPSWPSPDGSTLVSHGADADLLLARRSTGRGRRRRVDASQPSVDGARTLASVTLGAGRRDRAGRRRGAAAAVGRALDRGALGTAAAAARPRPARCST